jgi:hypothetical protein
MSFAATISSSEGRKFSIGGPLRGELLTFTAVSGDTSGTITSKNLHQIYHCIIDGVQLTAAPTFSSGVATVTFADPGANAFGTILLIGV